jgi:hypothetical protein
MAVLTRAGIERTRGDAAAPSRRFLAAATEFERLGQPFDAARGHLGAGEAAADRGDAPGGRALAGRALAIVEELGAVTAAAPAREVLGRR